MTRVGIAAGVLIILFAAIFFGVSKTMKKEEAATTTSAPKPTTTTTAVASPRTDVPAEKPLPSRLRRIDAETRQRLLAQILAARTRRGETSSGEPGTPGAPRELTKDYIQTQVRALAPLIKECYEKELADDPKLEGKLMVRFTMGGEPDVGGVIEDSNIDMERSTITNASMVECVRETMYGLEFDPPIDGGKVVVDYPFVFSSAGSPSK